MFLYFNSKLYNIFVIVFFCCSVFIYIYLKVVYLCFIWFVFYIFVRVLFSCVFVFSLLSILCVFIIDFL